MNGMFRFIRLPDMLWRLAQGWTPAGDLGPIHGEWSLLMQWCCGDCGGEYAP